MLSRNAWILLFKLLRYRFSMRLCAFWRLAQGGVSLLAREFCCYFRVPFVVVGLFVRTLCCPSSHSELDSELPGDEGKLGIAMEGEFSLDGEGLVHASVGVLVLFSKSAGITHASMSDF